ncbi:MAG: hypothetical protein WBL39_09155 [Terrimicrobiaceae bacterium]
MIFSCWPPRFRPALVADRVQHLSMDGAVFGPDGGEPVVLLADVTADTWQSISWPANTRETVRRLLASVASPAP